MSTLEIKVLDFDVVLDFEEVKFLKYYGDFISINRITSALEHSMQLRNITVVAVIDS